MFNRNLEFWLKHIRQYVHKNIDVTQEEEWRELCRVAKEMQFDEDTSGNKKTEVVVKLISPEDQKTKNKK